MITEQETQPFAFTTRYRRIRIRFLIICGLPIFICSLLVGAVAITTNPIGVLLIAVLIAMAFQSGKKQFAPLTEKDVAMGPLPSTLKKPEKYRNCPNATKAELSRCTRFICDLGVLAGVTFGVFETWKGISSLLAAGLVLLAVPVAWLTLMVIAWALQV